MVMEAIQTRPDKSWSANTMKRVRRLADLSSIFEIFKEKNNYFDYYFGFTKTIIKIVLTNVLVDFWKCLPELKLLLAMLFSLYKISQNVIIFCPIFTVNFTIIKLSEDKTKWQFWYGFLEILDLRNFQKFVAKLTFNFFPWSNYRLWNKECDKFLYFVLKSCK